MDKSSEQAKQGFKLNDEQKANLTDILYANETAHHTFLHKIMACPYALIAGYVDRPKEKNVADETANFLHSLISDSMLSPTISYYVAFSKPSDYLISLELNGVDVSTSYISIDSALYHYPLATTYRCTWLNSANSLSTQHKTIISIALLVFNYTNTALFLLPSAGMASYILARYLQHDLPADLLGWDIMQATISVGGIALGLLLGTAIAHAILYQQMNLTYSGHDPAIDAEVILAVEDFINTVYVETDAAVTAALNVRPDNKDDLTGLAARMYDQINLFTQKRELIEQMQAVQEAGQDIVAFKKAQEQIKREGKLNEQQKAQLSAALYSGEKNMHAFLHKVMLCPYALILSGIIKPPKRAHLKIKDFLQQALGTAFTFRNTTNGETKTVKYNISNPGPSGYCIDLNESGAQRDAQTIKSDLDNVAPLYKNMYFDDSASPFNKHPYVVMSAFAIFNYTSAGLFLLPSLGMSSYILVLHLQNQLPADLLSWGMMQATISVGGIGLGLLLGALILHGVTYQQMKLSYYGVDATTDAKAVAGVEDYMKCVYVAMDTALTVAANFGSANYLSGLNAQMHKAVEGATEEQKDEIRKTWAPAVLFKKEQAAKAQLNNKDQHDL
ncbi:MAG: hypothetical protein JSS50_00205 [Proteobacteria bacterium]|nr:hypothetical protein [Pseudomonadota bacterium]